MSKEFANYIYVKMKSRNPIIAGIMSILITGFGQLYNGQLKKSILFVILIHPLVISLGMTGIFSTFSGMIISLIIIILYKLYVLIDAVKWAKKQHKYELKKVNSWKFYLAFLFFWFILVFSMPPIIKHMVGYESFEILTPSMEPTISVGDKVFATKIDGEHVQLGDIISFRRDDGHKYLSRVVGLANQQIRVEDDVVIINENSEIWKNPIDSNDVEFEFTIYNSILPNNREFGVKMATKFNGHVMPQSEFSNVDQQLISNDEVFVMGDYRNNSMDSRMYGNIPFENIEKKVNYIWWSKDKKRIGVKLD